MYCNIDDIIKRLSEKELILLSSDNDNIDTETVNTAIADADAIIDSYLAKAYNLPLDNIPNIIKKISVELAIIHLNDKRTQNDEAIEIRRKNVLNLLDKIAKKQIIINPNQNNDIQSKKILFHSKNRLFKRGL